jgi:hypothetical protein
MINAKTAKAEREKGRKGERESRGLSFGRLWWAVVCQALIWSLLTSTATKAEGATGFRIYWTVAITNNPITNGMTLSAGADVRDWATNVTNSATQIAISNSIPLNRTNLFVHLGNYRFTGFSVAYGTNTNDVVLIGNTNVATAISQFGNWASITARTNPVYGATPVTVPFTTESNALREFVASALIDILNTWSTNRLSNSAAFLAEVITTRTTPQNVTNLSTRNGTNYGGVADGMSGQFRNVGLSNVLATNLSSPGSGLLSQQIGFGASASGARSVVMGVTAVGSGSQSSAYGYLAKATNSNTFAGGYGSLAGGADSTAVGSQSDSRGTGSSAFGAFATVAYDQSTALGYLAVVDAVNQIMLGRASDMVVVPGFLSVRGTGYVAQAVITNSTIHSGNTTNTAGQFATLIGSNLTATSSISETSTVKVLQGTNLFTDVAVIRRFGTNEGVIKNMPGSDATLVEGNNQMARPTNNLVRLTATAGPAIICGIGGNFGNGDWFDGVNETGYSLTFTNESGFITSADTNMLRVPYGVAVVPPNGMFRATWLSSISRWYVAILGPDDPHLAQYVSVNGQSAGGQTNLNFVEGPGVDVLTTNETGTLHVGISGPGMPPVGGVVAWLKSLTNTVSLDTNYWAECNGQTLSNTNSPFHGLVIPDLNGLLSGTNRFLMGGTNSGTMGGASNHVHAIDIDLSYNGVVVGGAGSGYALDADPDSTESTANLPPYYQVVWVMRIR